MTPLQILRHALKGRGATLTLTWLEGPGYCIVVDDVTEAGEPVRWVIEAERLDQAIQRLLQDGDPPTT
jgi:orotate phosphoribosyltransferase